jgi:hypothetical protein
MSKKLSLMAGVLGALALLTAPAAYSQSQSPAPSQAPAAPSSQGPEAKAPAARGKWHHGHKRHRYNPQAAETITGTVVSIKQRTAKKPGRPARVSMLVRTDKGKVRVTLGPADYLDKQSLKPAVGDKVEVRGIPHTRGTRTLFVAGEVKKGEQVLKLHDETTGRPLWATGQTKPGS